MTTQNGKINDKLVSLNILINKLNEVSFEHHKSNVPMVEHDFRKLIHSVPDSLLRCKDCIYYVEHHILEYNQSYCQLTYMDVNEHEYCSKGERKDI